MKNGRVRGREGLPSRGMPALLLAIGCALLLGCSGGSSADGSTDADTLTRRQKDSILSELPIPGAGAVGTALDAADKAEERARQLDTMGQPDF